MCEKYFDYFFSTWTIDELNVVDPEAWLDKKIEWTPAKRLKYYRSIYKVLDKDDPTDSSLVGSFKTMVKSGEVYKTDSKNVRHGKVFDTSDRPRNI